ncbi:PQQ-dependent sugar dehydrogenase [Aeromicrobium sp. CF3.5]|uniref:PQQ-dependent sugar dehydrogenase n=1 Tax=Aeromicrobium sp. CF3.5 TaxID=3373078 RepID=UPI003EE52535
MDRRTLLIGLAGVGATALVGCSRDDTPTTPDATPPTPTTPTTTPGPEAVDLAVAGTIATGLNVPWGLAFLPEGDALVSQRDDATIVRISTSGEVTELGSVPDVTPGGEAGLLGIALDPDDPSVLFAFTTTASDDRVLRMSIADDSISDVTAILTGIPIGSRHHGGRLLFDADGMLFVSTGDAGRGETAQDRDALNGKILRITTDGDAAPDNPFGNRTWSYGHRNIEGLAFDADGRLWATEFGEKEADELNLIERGGNYGWPQVEGTGGGEGEIDPLVTWGTDECSPAGVAIAQSTAFVAALQGQSVFAVPLDGESAGDPIEYFAGEYGRIRNVFAAPDGSLWVTTSNTDGRNDPAEDDDRILRVTV